MKRFSEQLHSQSQTLRLKASERRALRERLVSYMEYHPLPKAMKVPGKVADLTFDGEVKLVSLNWRRLAQYTGALLGVLVLSVSYLAEKSIPGDALYAVKVGFNEELRSTLARSSYEKIVWETERLNRRIAEARLLASEGKLTEEAEELVAQAVRTHSDNARREIAQLKQTNREEATLASIKLDTAIAVQTATLQSSAAEVDGRKPNTRLVDALVETKVTGILAGEEAELPSYGKLMASVERETTRAYELLASVKKRATQVEQSDIKRRLEDIERVVAEAMGKHETNDVEAREELLAAIGRIERLVIFMTNIDVRSAVTVEQIVPVTKTLAERTTDLTAKFKDLQKYTAAIKEVQGTSTQVALAGEKVTAGLVITDALLAEINAGLASSTEDIAVLETKALEAEALLTDMIALLEIRIEQELISDENTEANEEGEPKVELDLSTSTIEMNTGTTSTSTASTSLTEV